MLSEAAESTKIEHLRKVRQGIVAVVETIAPGLVSWMLNLLLERWGDLECR